MRPGRVSIFAIMTACAAAPQSATPPVHVPAVVAKPTEVAAPVAAPAPAPSEAAEICAGMDVEAPELVRVRVEDVALECPEGKLERCAGEIRYTVANCSAEPVELRALRLEDWGNPKRAMIVEPGEKRIAPGGTWGWKTHVFREDSLRVRVEVVDAAEVPIRVVEQPVRVTNPTREAALAACKACNGTWGIQGLVYRDACNCQARDAGQECHDGDACEGACKFDRWAISSPAEPVRCKGKKCSARLSAIGRPVGRCSTMVAIRSCHTLLQEGIAGQPDQPVPWGVTRRCID